MGENCLVEGCVESNPEGAIFEFSALLDLIDVPLRHILFRGHFQGIPYGQRTNHAVRMHVLGGIFGARDGSRALLYRHTSNDAIFQQYAGHLGAGLPLTAVRRDHPGEVCAKFDVSALGPNRIARYLPLAIMEFSRIQKITGTDVIPLIAAHALNFGERLEEVDDALVARTLLE